MLPARSKRYASVDGDIPRERLTSGWQLLLLVLVVLTLFYLVFPKKVLVQRLYDQDRLDDLSLSYVQNIYRADTRNADAALLLARHRAQDMDPLDLENMIRPHLRSDDPRQRGIARQLLLVAFQRQFVEATSPAARERLRERVAEVIRLAMDDRMDEDLAHSYAKLAYQLDLMELGSQLLAKFASALTVAELEQLGYEAMGRQEYAKASYYFMLARERSTDLVRVRRYYQLGVSAYMAGGLYKEALVAAETHLGRLRGDMVTLRYLVKLALAAGDPVLASYYAKQLVFRLPMDGKAP